VSDYWTYVGRVLAYVTVVYAFLVGLGLAFLVGRAVV
jgi:hypothetical protein